MTAASKENPKRIPKSISVCSLGGFMEGLLLDSLVVLFVKYSLQKLTPQ